MPLVVVIIGIVFFLQKERTAAILLDRTMSLLSIIVCGFILFMLAFGRQATKQAKKS